MTQALTTLICPLDGTALSLHERSWRCPHGHSFDVAKQGYVNLLPVQNKRSKDPGDSKAMVQARQRFLARGTYQPLAQVIADAVLENGEQSLLDAGCGEGYYLRHIIDGAEQVSTDVTVAALDISKWAVQAAAKQDKRITWLVASNNSIPLTDHSVDTLLCVFGFPVSAEFKRVLKPGGRLLMVDPAPQHLIELKRIIYPEVKTKADDLPVSSAEWALSSEQRLTFTVELTDNDSIQDLLIMTPHLYRSSKEGRERAGQLDKLSLTADIWVRIFTAN